jgi:glutaredoxin
LKGGGPHFAVQVTLYSRPGCHLCDEMKAVILRVAARVPLTLREVDISVDSDLERRFGEQIPVLFVEEQQVARYRITETQLLNCLLSPR